MIPWYPGGHKWARVPWRAQVRAAWSITRRTVLTLLDPPLNWTPAFFAGFMVVFGATFILREDLFFFGSHYAVMAAWGDEVVWGTLALGIGIGLAASSELRGFSLRLFSFVCTVYLGVVALALMLGPVGWGPYTTAMLYLAVGSGRVYVRLRSG